MLESIYFEQYMQFFVHIFAIIFLRNIIQYERFTNITFVFLYCSHLENISSLCNVLI
jgi:hypothetical protein